MGNYLGVTKEQQEEMKHVLNIQSTDDLYRDIPDSIFQKEGTDLKEGLSQLEVIKLMKQKAATNTIYASCYRGAGAYRHFIPPIVDLIAQKESFVTSYTPYQPEISQGILQIIFEFQTLICMLTGMDVSNASVYDGATAAAEAIAMCVEKQKKHVLVSETINPEVKMVLKNYEFASGIELEYIPEKNGKTDLHALPSLVCENTACIYVESPNFFGILEDLDTYSTIVKEKGLKSILGVNPMSLGILKQPSAYGIDIVVGEGQPLGIPLSYGGPYLGFMATKQELVRKLPGRIVGETLDHDGKRAFVLTLQAREQHIRREKASSNICSNQALCALRASVYLSAVGPNGFRQVSNSCAANAHYLAEEMFKIHGFYRGYPGEFFHEFVSVSQIPSNEIIAKLEEHHILAPLPLSENKLLWCVTEVNQKEEMDYVLSLLKEVSEDGIAI